MASSNMHKKLGKVWTYDYCDMCVDRKTNKHTLITILHTGEQKLNIHYHIHKFQGRTYKSNVISSLQLSSYTVCILQQ